MKKFCKILTIFLSVLMVQNSICCLFSDNLTTAYADTYYDEDFDFSSWETKDFPNVIYVADEVKLTKSSQIKDSVIEEPNESGCTRIYPFILTQKQYLRLSFTDDTWATMKIAIVDSNGNVVVKKNTGPLEYQSKKYTFSLDEGKYYLKIYTDSNLLEQDTYYLTLCSTEKTINKSMASCTTYKLKPGLGDGTWKTSNSSIVSLSKKRGSTCTIRAKKSGTATVTFENSTGKCSYKIKVYKYKDDPFRAGYIEMDSVGGIEPVLFVVNNSDKTIKYIDFRISCYNAVGDKVYNEIGHYGSSSLQIVGPLKPWHGDMYCWDSVFYNNTVSRIYIKQATITYMDNTKETISIKKSFNYSDKKFDERYYSVNL